MFYDITLGKRTDFPGIIMKSRCVVPETYLIAPNIYISSIHMSKLKKRIPDLVTNALLWPVFAAGAEWGRLNTECLLKLLINSAGKLATMTSTAFAKLPMNR